MTHTISQKYECLDYDKCENVLTRSANERRGYSYTIKTELFRWILFFLIGFFTAIAGTSIEIGIDLLADLKYENIRHYINECSTPNCIAVPMLIWVSSNLLLVAAGTALVVYVEPIASGSGVAAVKAYLNGINVRHFIHVKTLFVKLVSVIFAIVGGLGVGKEGPMVHAGTIIGGGLSQGRSSALNKEIKWLAFFRHDSDKRDFAAAGAGTGIAAAFGAPIGGVLFTLEETSSFWKQSHVLRTLFATLNGSFFLNLFMSLYIAKFGQLSAEELLNLGKFNGTIPWHLAELPFFLLIGAIGGIVGALFNCLSYYLANLRLRMVQRRHLYVIEGCAVALMSALMGLTFVYATAGGGGLFDPPNSLPGTSGTPLSMLQLPQATLQKINEDAAAAKPGVTTLRIAALEEPTQGAPLPSFARETLVEVGFVCKKCRLAYPSETGLLGHQRTACFPGKSADSRGAIRLTQTVFECKICPGAKKAKTILEFRQHCETELHCKKRNANLLHPPPPPPPPPPPLAIRGRHLSAATPPTSVSPSSGLTHEMEDVVNQITLLAAQAAEESGPGVTDSNANIAGEPKRVKMFLHPSEAVGPMAVSTGQ